MCSTPKPFHSPLAALKESSADVPVKLLYLIQLEQDNAEAFWINEIWESKAAYDACLAMPQTGDWGAKLAPLLVGIEHRTETVPLV